MISSFIDMGISPVILKAIDEMGFKVPTEVQIKTIPHVFDQKDLIVMSKTGSGKTAAFGIPMLQMINAGAPGPQGLILAPTRELAVQVDSNLKQLSKGLQLRTMAVYGQHSMGAEIQDLKRGVAIVTGTPGRLYDHIRQGNLITKNISFLVLDEADRMLDMGFYDQVVRIIETLPKGRVTLLFSATMPAEIRRICREYMKQPITVEIESKTKTVDTIAQAYYRVDENDKRTQLHRLLIVEQPESCMIFCNTRVAVDRVQSFLTRKGLNSQSLHGDIPQSKRMKTIQQFKQGDFHILVATDVAARGIHIEGLSLVINYDVPVEKDSYVHRIGRTGRAGNGGRAITLVTSNDIMSLYEIEEHIGAMIAEEELPTDAIYNERISGAEKWILANSQKESLQNNNTEPALKSVKKQPYSKRPPYNEIRNNEKRNYDKRNNEKHDIEKRNYEKSNYEKRGYSKWDNNKQDYEKRNYGKQNQENRSAYHTTPRKEHYSNNQKPQISEKKNTTHSAASSVIQGSANKLPAQVKTTMPGQTQGSVTANKKPLLQRILQLIFNKKEG